MSATAVGAAPRFPGRFVTLEGIEGAGKSTVARALVAHLQSRGLQVTATREPGGTPLAEQIRSVLLQPRTEPLPPTAELLLMFAARAVHLDNCIRPALAAGHWVICDRFTDATRAYQGAGRGMDATLIETLAMVVQHGLEPDRVLLLDLPAELGLERAGRRHVAAGAAERDRFEREGTAFFDAVRRGYLQRASAAPDRFRVIDASRDESAVIAQALDALRDLV